MLLEMIKNWLTGYSDWGKGALNVEYTDPKPGNTGLFCEGVQELWRKHDILGGVRIRNRCSFTLRRVGVGQCSSEKDAKWLLDFQQWVRQQSLQGQAPQLGEECCWRAQKGRLAKASQTGTGMYTVELYAEYTQID